MMKRIILLVTALAASACLLLPTAVQAQSAQQAVCEGVGSTVVSGGSNPGCSTTGTTSVDSVLHTVLNLLSYIVGFASVIMIIVGGFRFVMAGGDSGNVTAARNTILYAVIGLAVAAVSQLLVKFVLHKVQTGK